jgi:hypothetical protein
MRSLTARLFRKGEEGPVKVGLIATETTRGGLLHAADSGKGLDKRCFEACNAGSEEKQRLRDDTWEIPAERTEGPGCNDRVGRAVRAARHGGLKRGPRRTGRLRPALGSIDDSSRAG